jgi:hypothetical protein
VRTVILSENLKGRDHAEDIGVDGRIIAEWIFEILGGKAGHFLAS